MRLIDKSANNLSEDLMATPLRTRGLSDYDARLLGLAHQLDAERREIVMKFAEDLLLIPLECDFESGDLKTSDQLLH